MNVRDADFDIDDDGGPEPPRADLLAGEYVLGVLDTAQRAEAEARRDREPAFARLVADWEWRLAPWLDAVPDADVPAHVWPRIRRELGWPAVGPARSGLWHSTGFWRATAALAAVVAIVAVLAGRVPVDDTRTPPVAVTPPPAPPAVETAPALPVTTLAHEDGSPAWLASIDAAQGRVLVVPVPGEADAQGRVAELWLIPEGGSPASLGLVSNDRSLSVDVPSGLRAALVAGATLAVSLEPPGGAPHGAPTGPIVASGTLRI
ncbi:anti-sigma factor domain-containing protein [Luteimonas sp. WGS1318]|uniref:anti-sigma factor n=1 Tax=Luteimonas sp. WGS1318 TaxID=3366815 RepID=UPI00372D134A